MREFEKVYRVREQDDVLTKMNTILRSVDLRLDSVEQAKEALESGNHADVDALVQSINEDISQKSAAIQALIDEQAAGFDPDRIRETPEKRFTSDAEIQELKDSDTAISDALVAHASTVDQELAEKLDKDATAADSAKLGGKEASEFATAARKVSAGTGLSGGGDLSSDRTLSVKYGTTAGTAVQGNDSRIADAIKATDLASTDTGKGAALVGVEAIPGLTATQVQAALAELVAKKTSYVSGEQTITTGGLLTLTHGLGSKPSLVVCVFVCVAAEGGYSVGDEVQATPGFVSGNRGMSVVADSTNINIRLGAAAPGLINKSTGEDIPITPSKWRLVAKAWSL